jgi:hypothetical protein
VTLSDTGNATYNALVSYSDSVTLDGTIGITVELQSAISESLTLSESNDGAPFYAGLPKVWVNGAWEFKPVKVWDGTQFVEKPIRRWTGASWI